MPYTSFPISCPLKTLTDVNKKPHQQRQQMILDQVLVTPNLHINPHHTLTMKDKPAINMQPAHQLASQTSKKEVMLCI